MLTMSKQVLRNSRLLQHRPGQCGSGQLKTHDFYRQCRLGKVRKHIEIKHVQRVADSYFDRSEKKGKRAKKLKKYCI
jgi:hypothetical protein